MLLLKQISTKHYAFFFCIAVLFTSIVIVSTSCKKEYSFEATHGTVRDGSGPYYGWSAHGVYKAGVPLNDSNYILITVNISKLGNHPVEIKSDVVNGYSFAASVFFTQLGMQQVKLKGSGTPIQTAITHFEIVFDNDILPVMTDMSAEPGQGFIDFDMDGQHQHFNDMPRAQFGFGKNFHSWNLYAGRNNDSSSTTFNLFAPEKASLRNYKNTAGDNCAGFVSFHTYLNWDTGPNRPGSIEVTINSMSYTRISGNFKGVFKKSDYSFGKDSVLITNGKFDLPIW